MMQSEDRVKENSIELHRLQKKTKNTHVCGWLNK